MSDPHANEVPQSRSQKLAALKRQAEEAVRKNREDRKAAWPEEYKKYLVDQAKAREEGEREARFNTNLDLSRNSYPINESVPEQSSEQCADIPVDEVVESAEVALFDDPAPIIDEPRDTKVYKYDEPQEVIKTYPKVRYTPWDRAKEKLRLADEKLSGTVEGTTEHAIAKRKYDEALRKFRIEEQRDSDPKWRALRSNDIWRAGEGKEVFNKSRRKVRDNPNMDLSGLTPEQKRQRELEQDRVRKAIKREAERVAKAAALNGGPVITEGMFSS